MKRFANPVPQFLKNNGDLASGGKLYFYQAGSDVTFKTIYSDEAGATPLANPVNLSNEGRVTSIYGDGEYRVKFYDQNNVLQWSREYDFSEDSAQFEEWNSQISYSINDVSRGADGYYYISQTNGNLGNDPTNVSSSGDWSQIALLEVWNADKVGGYANDAVVIRNGALYASNAAGNTTTPPSASWDNLTFNNTVTGNLTVSGSTTTNTLAVTTSATVGTTLAVTGSTTLAAVSATSSAVSGAATVGTTLGVTGATTLAAVSATSAAISGAATVGTTLGVTGQISGSAGITVGNVAQAGATILDWYQEGTFTPTIVGSPTPGVGTYTTQVGAYTRIGNRVFFTLEVATSSHTGSTDMYVSGLPFTSVASSPTSACSIVYSGLTVGAGKELGALVSPSSTNIILYTMDQAGGARGFLPMDGAVGSLLISGSYQV